MSTLENCRQSTDIFYDMFLYLFLVVLILSWLQFTQLSGITKPWGRCFYHLISESMICIEFGHPWSNFTHII